MSSDSVKETGCVKWFNNKSGYGFISSCGDNSTDVFVHHSSLSVKDEQYRYLVTGEYVEYSKEPATNEHEWQATSVTGIKGGKLMCETRNEMRNAAGQDGKPRKSSNRRGNKKKSDNNTEEKEYLEVAHE